MRYKSLLVAAFTILLSAVILIACSAPAAAPSAPVVQTAVVTVKETSAPVVQTVVSQATAAPSTGAGLTSAQRAVEAAKQYAGITLNVPWESALQAQDPELFSGPEFEKLTGIKINTIETSFTDLVSKQITEHIGGTGAYDVLSISPVWLPDFVEAGALEDLGPYMDKYMDKSELDDIPATFRVVSKLQWQDLRTIR